MRYEIKHEIKGRVRIHLKRYRMSFEEADSLELFLNKCDEIDEAKVYERTCDAVIRYNCSRSDMISLLNDLNYDQIEPAKETAVDSGRQLNSYYKEKLIDKLLFRFARKIFLPYQLRVAFVVYNSLKYVYKGVKCLASGKLEVPVLDATAIGVSVLRGNFSTAGSIMFLLGLGELLEEWTHKKSVSDLANSMSINADKVWLKTEEGEILVSSDEINIGDTVLVHMGNVIPFDGVVKSGEALVNQSSMTGEPLAVRKEADGYVYAGTVIEEGELAVKVKETRGSTKYEKIVTMIEDTQKLKSSSESRAEHLADKLVPYTLLGTAAVWLVTRNVTKALAVLMVDFSCALKLAMPVSVLSAIKEARDLDIMVKGGKYLEEVANADTVVFDKTGTLTKACPVVKDIVTFGGEDRSEMLRIAACLEEHFPHSMAKAVVDAAKSRGLEHEEMHSKVEYIVAHGIASEIEDRRVVIGSYHFVFEDEACTLSPTEESRFDQISAEYSHLYMAIDGLLSAVICIEDPLREEAAEIVAELKAEGIKKVVIMTGDSEKTAASIAARVGVDEYHAEVLPEDKAEFIKNERAAGAAVIMIGDGINDSPALSAANVGIAISDGAEIAREIADITIAADSLRELVVLRRLSRALINRIDKNYKSIVGINTALIIFGVTGIMTPTLSAWLHNASTLGISLGSMQKLLK